MVPCPKMTQNPTPPPRPPPRSGSPRAPATHIHSVEWILTDLPDPVRSLATGPFPLLHIPFQKTGSQCQQLRETFHTSGAMKAKPRHPASRPSILSRIPTFDRHGVPSPRQERNTKLGMHPMSDFGGHSVHSPHHPAYPRHVIILQRQNRRPVWAGVINRLYIHHRQAPSSVPRRSGGTGRPRVLAHHLRRGPTSDREGYTSILPKSTPRPC